MSSRLDWRGEDVLQAFRRAAAGALMRFALMIESGAKETLQPGAGVRTGTLRRSIHVARPGYNWSHDDVEPGPYTPERGSQEVEPGESADKLELSLEIGSGLVYAMPVHQGFGGFPGYHYIMRPFDALRGQFVDVLREFLRKEGLH